MNDLELIRAQLVGIRAQAEAAIRNVTELMERLDEPEPEREPPRTFGGKPTPKENKDG